MSAQGRRTVRVGNARLKVRVWSVLAVLAFAGVGALAGSAEAVPVADAVSGPTPGLRGISWWGADTSKIDVRIGDVTFHIPRAFVDSGFGYHDELHLQVLLPCLSPETKENSPAFHKDILGDKMIIILSLWEPNKLVGKDLFDVTTQDYSSFMTKRGQSDIQPLRRDLGAERDFDLYKDSLNFWDIFVLRASEPLFLVTCYRRLDVLYPSCSVREKLAAQVLLQYEFNRDFIDTEADNAAGIDESKIIDQRVKRLMQGFIAGTI